MIRFILSILFFSFTCNAEPTNKLIILTTFSESSLAPLTETFQQHYPDTSIKILHRRVESGRQLLEKSNHDIDIVITSSLSLFHPLLEQNRLFPLRAPGLHAKESMEEIGHTIPGHITVFGYSGYGLMWNKKYLTKHELAEPRSWESLADPQYFRHIIMSSPSRSGTTHLMVEDILQRHGWDEGWEILLQIGGNLGSLSARSLGVSDAVSRGLAGIGPVIDSFAYESQKQFSFIGFSYQQYSPILPSYIAAVKNAHPARHSHHLIEYLLSDPVQQSLSFGSLNKYSLHQQPSRPFSRHQLDHELVQQREILIKQLFNQIINHQLLLLNQAWQLIHKIDQIKPLTDDQRRRYNQAVALASTPPVSQEQATSTDFLQALTRSRTDLDTAKRLNHWRQTMRTQLEKSIVLSEGILADTREAH